MTRSPIGLLIVLALLAMMLYGSGAISWTPTPWEQHAAHAVTQTVSKSAKSVGVKVNVPPKPTWQQPAPSTATQQPQVAPPATTPDAQTQQVTQVYPVGNGQTVTAPPANPSITAAYCALENIPHGEDGCP